MKNAIFQSPPQPKIPPAARTLDRKRSNPSLKVFRSRICYDYSQAEYIIIILSKQIETIIQCVGPQAWPPVVLVAHTLDYLPIVTCTLQISPLHSLSCINLQFLGCIDDGRRCEERIARSQQRNLPGGGVAAFCSAARQPVTRYHLLKSSKFFRVTSSSLEVTHQHVGNVCRNV